MEDNKEKSNNSNKPREYSEEFKNSAVELANKIGVVKAAKRLNIYSGTLSKWIKKTKQNNIQTNNSKTENANKQFKTEDKNNKNSTQIKTSSNNKNEEKSAITKEYVDEKAVNLYNSLKKDINDEKLSLIDSITKLIIPLNNFVKSETGKRIEENANLKHELTESNNKITDYQNKLQTLNKDIENLKNQKSELENKIKELETNNNELNEKLNDAYSINSREASLEAEKIREDLKKSFTYLYEEWQEYSDSEFNENNYESLQAIINKMFRALRKSGIEFRGENK